MEREIMIKAKCPYCGYDNDERVDKRQDTRKHYFVDCLGAGLDPGCGKTFVVSVGMELIVKVETSKIPAEETWDIKED